MCVKHLIDCFANVTLLDNLEQSPMQIAMQKQYGDIVELLRTSAHGPLYMRPPNGFMSEVPAYPSAGHTHQLVTPPTSKKRKSKSTSSSSASASNFHGKFGPSGGYPSSSTTATTPTSSSHLHRDNIPMSEFQHHQQLPTTATPTSSYTHHPSPSNYPPPPGAPSHSPPLPPTHSAYPTTSNHGHTPSSYEHQQVMVGESEMPAVSVAPHTSPPSSSHLHSSVVEAYPLYPSTADVGTGTRPLQHLPVVTEAGIQTSFATGHSAMTPDSVSNSFMHNPGGVYSPPQSSTVSQRSPQSAVTLQPSPNSYGTSPQSVTPSPESQQQSTIAAVGTVLQVEPGYNYPSHHFQHQHFMSSTPV